MIQFNKESTMIRLTITAEAYKVIIASLPVGTKLESQDDDVSGRWGGAKGKFIWLPEKVVNQIDGLREKGESYSDTIIRLAKIEGKK